jgi:MinD superfamily P-loop ATPase
VGIPREETTMEMVSMDGEREILGKIPRDMEIISFMVEEIMSQVLLADFRDFHNILSQHHTLLRWM